MVDYVFVFVFDMIIHVSSRRKEASLSEQSNYVSEADPVVWLSIRQVTYHGDVTSYLISKGDIL